MTPTAEPQAIDPNTPSIRNLLCTLTSTVRAQPNETDAEYEERFAAATATWTAFRPRDLLERLLAAQIVAAHYGALDCLAQAMEAHDPAQAEKSRRTHAALTRSILILTRLLDDRQQRPADTAPLPVIETIPPLRQRPPEQKTTQKPMHREERPAAPMKDPSKMTDAELQTAMLEKQQQCTVALFDDKHPMHREIVQFLPELVPGIVIPDSYREDAPDMAA